MQAVVRDELKKAVERFQAKGGSAWCWRPVPARSSPRSACRISIRTTTSAPTIVARFNRNIQGSYELGSLFKVLTAGMALDSGAVKITDSFDAVEPFRMNRYRIKDFHAKKRRLSVPEVIAFSSNIGAAKMAMAVGTERQEAYFRRFGLLDRHPIRLTEVSTPQRPKIWREINTVTASYGHGIAVSPSAGGRCGGRCDLRRPETPCLSRA